MNLEQFTDRAKGFLQSAQTTAIRLNHQRITPLHILKVLLDDSEGMAAGLVSRAGGDDRQASSLLLCEQALLHLGAEQVPKSYRGTFDTVVMINCVEHTFNAFHQCELTASEYM